MILTDHHIFLHIRLGKKLKFCLSAKERYILQINLPPQSVSINSLMMLRLFLIRGNSPCNLCKNIEVSKHHILVNCSSKVRTERVRLGMSSEAWSKQF